MNYEMTTPCDACPFLKGSGFTWNSLVEHSSGEFACHKTCEVDEDEDSETYGCFVERNENTPHCAGALIFLEKQEAARTGIHSHQMMRIMERFGDYDRRKLNMDAPVVEKPQDCRKEDKYDRRRRARSR